MKAAIWTGMVVLLLVIQATIVPMIAIGGVKLDLMLILVVSTGLMLGREQGVAVGFIAGLLQDLASGNIFGLNSLTKLAIGYIFGLAERKVFKEHILLPVLSVAIGTIASNLLAYLFLLMLNYKVDFFSAFVQGMLPQAVYNMLLAFPLHWCIYRATQKLR